MTGKTTTKPQTPGEYVRKKALQPKKMSVTKAAEVIGVGRPAFSNFLNGKAALSPDMAARIERAFGIPAKKLHDLQASYDAAQAKTKGAPSNTNAYVPKFLEITAGEIENWSSKINARPRLSVLLRTLVNSTGIGLTKVNFPGNDDAERPGWDGFITASEGTPWIPEGNSGWEFGCNQYPKDKADKDFAKSVKAVSKAERDNTIFIFATPRRWPGKEKWVREHIVKNQWKDVRAYDASDLEQWLGQSVAGQTWFSDEIKRPLSSSTRSLDKCWSDWADVTHPSLVGALFKTAVESAQKTVAARLTKPPEEPIIIAADSTEEAVAFLAELFSETGGELAAFRDRVVVFDQPGTLPKLAAGSSNFIAVATTREVERELGPFCRSIHTIVVYPRNAINTEPHVLLEPLNYEAFRSALESMGFDRDEIDRRDHESGRSLTVLRRRLSKVPAVSTPAWAADKGVAASLAPFMFAGAWGSTNQCDQTILSFLANETPYEELEKRLQELAQLNDTPVWSVGNYRGVISKIDLLFAISGTITRPELETYFDVARYVLSEEDPSLDLPEKDRWAAGVYGKTREISGALRNGICETLVLFSVYGNALFQKKLGIDVEAKAIHLIRELLGDPLTTKALETHDRDLPTYAEVAPDEFLKILEKDLKSASPASFGLMRPADSGIFGGGCARTGILWALENVSWSPTTLLRAALVLARLAEIKIEDNWVNKPISSLNAIFCSWMPQTAANLDERIAVMELLAKRFPKIAWKICMDQFGDRQRIGHHNHKPRWRNDAQGFGEPVKTYGEMHPFELKMIDTALNWKDHDKYTVSDLIERLHDLDEKQQEAVWDIVKNWANTANDLDKAWVREKIRVTVMSRRGVARSKRRKTDKIDAAAKAAYSALEPTDILSKHEWLFRDIWVEESFEEIHDDDVDFRKRDERIAEMRTEALLKIMGKCGIKGVLTLAEMGKAPAQIGELLATKILPAADIVDFIVTITQPSEKVETWTYRGLAMGAIRSIRDDQTREETLKKIKKSLPAESFVKMLQLAPFRITTWSLVKEMDTLHQGIYWTTVSPVWEGQGDDELNDIVEQFLAAKRPRAAFACVHYTLEKLRPVLLFKLMEGIVTESEELDGHYQPQSWDLEKAFELLDASATFSVEQMAGLELSYIDVLSPERGGNRGFQNLGKYIEKHPEFFAQIVAWVYKRGDGGTDPEGLRLDNPEHTQNRATRGYRLIEGLQRIPGRNKQGDIETDLLLDWVNTVRKLCAELGRQDVGDLSLGKLLAEAPEGTDGVWPCEPVREVMEQIRSEKISDGVTVSRYNARGVHSRGEGGDQERELAEIYRTWASSLEFSHPFVASTILNDIANTYVSEAQREDTEAGVRRRLR